MIVPWERWTALSGRRLLKKLASGIVTLAFC